MRLPLLDRTEELARLRAFAVRREGSLAVLYGRRRCGKSRLLAEALPVETTAYVVADERESRLQRASVAREIGRRVSGFDRVTYPDWEALFAQWWGQAPAGSILAIDELPALVSAAPEVPSVLQKLVDRQRPGDPHLVLAGSSQRMMHGLVLDRTAPLFGRAAEILPIGPLPAGYVADALGLRVPRRAVEAFALWGGVPRYWELAADCEDAALALRTHVLSPLGVLHEEPARLLLDDLRDVAQSASILSLIGQGCHRLSEIAGRLGKPATALSRPLQRLIDLGLVRRELPFGAATRDTKRSAYRIADPFLAFWFRYVEPNRSRLAAGQVDLVAREIASTIAHHHAAVFEQLVRDSVPRALYFDRPWNPAARFWGPGTDRRPLEVDVVAESADGTELLVGEVKWTASPDVPRLLAELRARAARLPFAEGRTLRLALWAPDLRAAAYPDGAVFGAAEVLAALR